MDDVAGQWKELLFGVGRGGGGLELGRTGWVRRELWRIELLDVGLEGCFIDDGYWSIGCGAGVGCAVVIDVGGSLCGFVGRICGGGFWRATAWGSAGDFGNVLPEGLNVSSSKEVEAAGDTVFDGFLVGCSPVLDKV